MQKIIIATNNKGKFKELMEVLGDLPFQFLTLEEAGWNGIEPEESADTYEGNAIIKAEHVGKALNLPTIADDSGIHIDALEGELGVKTRRWGAGAKASDQEWLEPIPGQPPSLISPNAKVKFCQHQLSPSNLAFPFLPYFLPTAKPKSFQPSAKTKKMLSRIAERPLKNVRITS